MTACVKKSLFHGPKGVFIFDVLLNINILRKRIKVLGAPDNE